jgi:PAS domain S-box-containing protein
MKEQVMVKVLIVDDKWENLYLLQTMLDMNGFETIAVKNGAEALDLLRNNIPDLIISDILMPVMDGFTLCRECKKDETLKKIPFFFYTATYTDIKDKEYALGLGADRFILKPQEPDDFLKIINDFLEEIKNKYICPTEISQPPETIVLKEYNEVLIRKIEDKMLQTEKAEKEIKKYSEDLEKEIIERKKKEDSLQESQHLFQTLAQVSPVGIFRTSPDGNITYVNPKWSELAGLTFEEVTGVNWFNTVHPDDKKKVKEIWNSDMLSQKSSDAEYRFLRKDQSEIWVIGKTVPEWNNDKLTGYIGTITDITNNKKFENDLLEAKEKAEESDRLKTAFLNNISHEVRTPMNAIVGFSEILNTPYITPEDRNQYIEIIVQSSNQLLSIITQIVNMSTIEAGQEKIYKKEINLNSVFKLLLEQFSSEAARKNISIKFYTTLPDNEDRIITDETKLIQIISNLLSNAFKFTKQGLIHFGYLVKDKYLEFYIKDTGIGIPDEMHEEIFERFRQVETSMAREYGGSGLGLSIAKAYVELLGGNIWLTSKLGAGSIFHFTIPYNKTDPHIISDKQSTGKINIKADKTLTLLVAEDEDNNFLLIKEFLSNVNIAVIRAVNGVDAVEICKNNSQIDLVLMDLKMPAMDGFEATKRIREFRHDLPVIAQTAYAHDNDKNKAINSGCCDFISKPFSKEALLYKIKEQLDIG